jgi:hypothetical protein
MADNNHLVITGDCADAREAILRIHAFFAKDRGIRRITIRKECDHESDDKLADSDLIAAFQVALLDDKTYAPRIRHTFFMEAHGKMLAFDDMTRVVIVHQGITTAMR